MKKRLLLTICCMYCANVFAQTANISGTINTFSQVTATDTSACKDVITVVSAAGYSSGDTVLVIQMKGAEIDVTNSAAFGSVINYNGAGNYEFAVISNVSGNQITITGSLQKQYDPAGNVQLVSVPVYNNANVTATLTAPDWNGTTGGVLVFIVNGTLHLDAGIDMDGKGFRGGTISNNPDGGCGNNMVNDYYYDVNQGGGFWLAGGAEKGEGITTIPTTQMGGKGCLANGGGGGNKHNTGGAGGGNYTPGGKGGNELAGCVINGNGGIGGTSLPYNLQKIFFGGGGGCGDFNNGVGSGGADGGGIIIIKANTVDGNSYVVHANGKDELIQGGGIADGVGGGGAGGTILLDVQNFSASALTLQTNGGDGGDQGMGNFYGCVGTGGGGGTGILLISGPSLPSNVFTESTPGTAGKILNPAFSCYNTTYGATDGMVNPDPYLTGLILPMVQPVVSDSPVVDLGNDTTFCKGETWLHADQAGSTLLWNTGATIDSILVISSGSYWVFVDNGCSISSDTIEVIIDTFLLDLGNDTAVCLQSSLILDATNSGAISFQWQDGSTTPTFLAGSDGTYTLTAINSNGCVQSDSLTVSPIYPPVVNLGNDTIACAGSSILLNAEYADATYVCGTNETSSSIVINDTGSYYMAVTTICGTAMDTFIMNYTDCYADVFVPNAFTPNGDGLNDVFKPITSTISTYNLKIFNRWGQLVFHTTDPDTGWDGKIESVDEEIGVYIYIVNYVGSYDSYQEYRTIKGNLTLIR